MAGLESEFRLRGPRLSGFWFDAWQVLTSPARGFYRLAEGGGWLVPLALAGLFGLVSSGADPLKAVIVCALGGGFGEVWLAKAASLYVVLFPVYYAGSAAVFALVGVLLTGRKTGLGFRPVFRRVAAVLGWVSLPPLILSLAGLALVLGGVGPQVHAALAAAPPGTTPSFVLTPPAVVAVAFIAWLALLLVVALRQALAAGTGETVATIVIAGLVFGLFVQTPLARWGMAWFADEQGALGRGPARVSVSLQAYRLPTPRLPAYGDLVAYGPPEAVAGPLFIVQASGFTAVEIEGSPEGDLGLARVVGLPGDTVVVRGGIVYRNGEPADEPYLAGLERAKAHPTGLDLEETRVEQGRLYVLPDDRSLAAGLAATGKGPIVDASLVRGKVVVVQVRPWEKPAEAGSETPSG